ncbi:hypothetical protein Tco_0545252 [Tanacetum coccineum]
MDLTATAKNCFMELNELMELRDGAYENTRIYMERTKKWHDSRLRGDKDFKVGDLVLLFNSRFKMHPGTMYCSSTRWQTRQYEVLFRWRLDQSERDTWHSARVSTRKACVSTRSDYGNNVKVGGRQNDHNTPRSSNIIGWRLERTKLPPPTWGYKMKHAAV